MISPESNDTSVCWDKWKKTIERQFRFFRLTDRQMKKDGLIIYRGPQIADLKDLLPDLTALPSKDVYSPVIRKLNKTFLPGKKKKKRTDHA